MKTNKNEENKNADVAQTSGGIYIPTYLNVNASGASALPTATFNQNRSTSSSPFSNKTVNGLPLPTYNPQTQYATLPNGQRTNLPGRTVLLNPDLPEREYGIEMQQMPNQKKSVPFVPEEEEKKGRGGGGSTLPELPAELANQIADAYARSQGTGPDAWQDRYQAEIDGMRGQRYGDYESQYIPKIDGLVDRLLNRESFNYNWSDDPLYRQYAARYQQAARQGMQDTMGQAAAMTGGYGNSYATAAANQAYANQMAGLNDQAMNLYQLAAENYDRDTSNLRSNLQQLEQREAANRGNYDTDRATYYDRQDADLNNLLNQQAMDYQVWADEVARDQAERQMAWQQYAYWNDLYHNKYNYKK